ncbi:sugar ABC transporter substrate-binding protein [Mesorhizobium sp. M2C.T.Ca.TU.002.02.1.1]|uniref:ABC transporter substrate-binding protein n=1 Tax=Mesorhizobium sp. M2C.T.Ca.TU.002.02.1.1 TaxID=2496788 RepID=UPI0013E3A140|nr:sugar ABC transporter substrate-binding protein [Mesorhizobium sp. M2C.T.Ca.TU.002.02.1.1]
MSGNLSRRKFLAASAAVTAGSLAAPWVARAEANEITALLITGGPLYPKYWEKIVQDFTAKTGIKVRYDLLEFTPLTAKVVTLSAARSSQYDVYSTHTAQIDSYFNHFAPLNSYFSDAELADFYPVAVKYLRDPKTGNLAAIPRNMDARVQYYRSDIYQEKGLKPAETWEELVDVGLKLTGDGHYGLVVPGQGDPAQRTFSDLLWQAGGDWVDQANKPAFNSEAGIKALTFYRDLIQKHKIVPSDAVGYQWNENSTEFSSGTVYATFDWPGAFATLSNPETSRIVGKWSTAPYVRDKAAISCAISHAMALNGQSGRKDPAVEFIKYTVGADAQRLQFDQFTNFPSSQAIAKEVIAAAKGPQATWLQQLETTIANGKEWPKLAGFSKVCTLMFSAIEQALSDQVSPADSLNQAATEAEEIMRRAGAYD